MNSDSDGREYFYYMKVNICNCQAEVLKEFKFSFDTKYGDQYRRSPLRNQDFYQSIISK